MDEEIQKPEPKISDAEIVIIGLFYITLDVIDFLPAAGDITDIIAAPMGFYYWMKGLNGVSFIVSEVVEAIPGAQEIPFVRTISWGVSVWLDRSAKAQAILAPVLAVGAAMEGDITEEEAAAGSIATESTEAVAGGGTGAVDAGLSSDTQSTKSGGDTKPSETSTEEGSETRKKEAAKEKRDSGGGDEAEQATEGGEDETEEQAEQRRRDQKAQDYEEMMETEAETPPIEQAKKEDFAERGPNAEQEEINPEEQESESTRRLRERWAARQRARPQSVQPADQDQSEDDDRYQQAA